MYNYTEVLCKQGYTIHRKKDTQLIDTFQNKNVNDILKFSIQ